ncbi:hypothetical protein ACF0H5_009498 [Mactra antiquata]
MDSGIKGLYCTFVLLVLTVVCFCDVTINGHTKLISRRNNDFNTPIMTLHERAPAKSHRMSRFKPRPSARFESFNRPEGTEAFIVTTIGDHGFDQGTQDQYGRTFGKYGSYRKHKSWQKAVADDIQRQVPQNLKVSFPWLANHIQRPTLHGFGINFWNSYALPESTNTLDLGQMKSADRENSSDVVKTRKLKTSP